MCEEDTARPSSTINKKYPLVLSSPPLTSCWGGFHNKQAPPISASPCICFTTSSSSSPSTRSSSSSSSAKRTTTLWCSTRRIIITSSRWFNFDSCNRTALVFAFLTIPANLKTESHLLSPGLQLGQHVVPLSCSVPSSLVVNNSSIITTCASDSRWYTARGGTFCTRLFSCSCNQHQHVPTSLYVTLFTLSKISRGTKPSSSLKIFHRSALPSTSATDFPFAWEKQLSIDLGINKVQTSPGIGNARFGSHLVSNWTTLAQSFCNNSCIWKLQYVACIIVLLSFSTFPPACTIIDIVLLTAASYHTCESSAIPKGPCLKNQ